MSRITIPPEALEKGARAICEAENGPCECLPDECGCTYWTAHARASFLAIVEAWPGMLTDTFVLERDNWGGTLRSETALILPLPPPPAGETSDE